MLSLKKEEKQVLNRILQDKRTCKLYVYSGGDFCLHWDHLRNLGNGFSWGLCENVCKDFEKVRERGRR